MTVYTDPKKLQADAKEALNKIADYFDNSHYVKLGILGQKADRSAGDEDEEVTNAELGFIHEFGSVKKNIPIRSWLRMPIIAKTKDIIKAIAKQKKKIEKDAAEGNNPEELYKFLGVAGEEAVQEAFDTGGFGKWEDKKPTKANEGKMSPLIITGEMRRSVSSSVEENK